MRFPILFFCVLKPPTAADTDHSMYIWKARGLPSATFYGLEVVEEAGVPGNAHYWHIVMVCGVGAGTGLLANYKPALDLPVWLV